MNRNLVFAAGTALMSLGALDLYVGLAQRGVGEEVFAAIAQSFMLLFPGWVFMSYSLQKTPRLTSLDHVLPAPESAPAELDILNAASALLSGDSVVVPFPHRSGRGAGGKSVHTAHSK